MKQQALMIGGRGRWTAAIEAAGLAKFLELLLLHIRATGRRWGPAFVSYSA